MRWSDALLRLQAFFHARQMDEELQEELQFHLEMQARKNQRHEIDAAEAKRRARLQFGSIERATEECREARGIHFLEALLQDLRYGLRMLRKAPVFSTATILILALGIGSTTALFSVIYGLILEPFPYKNFERCVAFAINAKTQDQPVNSRQWFYIPELVAVRHQNGVFDDVAGYYETNIEWDDTNGTRNTRGAFVTTNTFDLLGVRPYRGRGIAQDDGSPDSPPVFVMNFKLWKSQFGGNPELVGKNFRVNGELRTLVGIMPPRFQFADGAGIWLPLSVRPGAEGQFIGPNLPVGLRPVARLRSGVTLERASADIDVILHRLAQLPPNDGRLPYPGHFTITTERLRNSAGGNFKKPLYALLGAVTMLLLIACGNVANLLLSRATARRREIAVRASFGASRLRLIQQLLVEVFVLSVVACIFGCALAYFGLEGVLSIIPRGSVPPEVFIGVSLPVVMFAVGTTLLTTVLCGLAPALHAMGGDLRAKLASSQGGITADSRRGQFRSSLVIFETALAIVLLIGAGLMIRTFFALTHVELGFNQERLLYARIALPKTRSPQEKQSFFHQVLEKLKSTPGVVSAAEVAQVPTLGGAFPRDVKVFGKVNQGYSGMFDLCSADVFQTLGLRLLRGSLLSEMDVNNARLVTVVNRTLAKQYFGQQDPIGQKIGFRTFDFIPDAPHNAYFEIVGVVSDFQNTHLSEPVIPEAFVPYTITAGGGRTILVRTAVDPKSLLATISQQVTSVDSTAAVSDTGVFQDLLDSQVKEPRFELIALNSFAVVGLLLAVAGVFSVMAHKVSLQTHEIGIRLALGAKQRTILAMVLGKGLLLVTVGALCGLGASFWLTRFIATQIWGVSTRDPWTFVTAIIVILLVGLAACVPPAYRAVRVDPMIALRYE